MRFDRVRLGLRVTHKGKAGTITHVPDRLETGAGYAGPQRVTVEFEDGTHAQVMPRWLEDGGCHGDD